MGLPLLPGGAPHPFEATLNLTSSSKTPRRPTALGVNRSWPRSPCRSSTFALNVKLPRSVSELWSKSLGGGRLEARRPFVAGETEPAGQPRGTKGPASAPAECIARRTRRHASTCWPRSCHSVGDVMRELPRTSLALDLRGIYADDGMLHVEEWMDGSFLCYHFCRKLHLGYQMLQRLPRSGRSLLPSGVVTSGSCALRGKWNGGCRRWYRA